MQMQVKDIIGIIEQMAPLALQEDYDNAGLLLGHPEQQISGVLVCLDVTEPVIDEAIQLGLDLIISHHPLIFKGLKKITGRTGQERVIIKAIRNNIAVYAAHTNLDHIPEGVSGIIADKIGLKNREILAPIRGKLLKLVTFVPHSHAVQVREALFNAGAGEIGSYSSCSYNTEGFGTFKASDNSNPYVGEAGIIHQEPEIRIEVILTQFISNQVIAALIQSHPYEEPAYDLIPLANEWKTMGAGMIGEFEQAIETSAFLKKMKVLFGNNSIKYTPVNKLSVKRIAFCGGSGSGFLKEAMRKKADVYISADFKYHEYFDAEAQIMIIDPGHYEMEQFTKEIFYEIIRKKFPTFAVRISEINTNPIQYL
jgi:dinuclear metal center YbgI/SA1388 family protein